MCCALSRRTNRLIGFILLSLFLIVSIASFIISMTSGKSYYSKYNPNQVDNNFKKVCAGLIFAFTLLGIIFLALDSKILTVIFLIGWTVLFLLTFIAGMIFFVLASNPNILSELTCSTIMNSSNAPLERYMQKVDENFCSSTCPCYISPQNLIKFKSNITLNIIDNWIQLPNNKTQFQMCTQNVRSQTFNETNTTDYALSFDYNTASNSTAFNETDFYQTWNYIENTYQCSGFCNTTYLNSKQSSVTMYKYLFSDINNGIPVYRNGCYRAMIDSFSGYTNLAATWSTLISLFMMITLINLFSYVCSVDHQTGIDDIRNVKLNQN